MKKIKLSKCEVTALKKSILHWEKDIIKYLEKGWTIYENYGFMNWVKKDQTLVSDQEVHCFADDCAMCILENGDCEDCSYNRYYYMSCQDELKGSNNKIKGGHWIKFKYKPNLKNARSMKESLERILKNQKIIKDKK